MSTRTVPDSARVLVLTGPREMDFVDITLPRPGPGDIVVKAVASAISHGTEMNVYRGLAPQLTKVFDPKLRLFLPAPESDGPRPLPERGYFTPSDAPWAYPLAYGYANVGEVVALGSDVTNVKVGDFVYAYVPHQTAYVIPAANAIPLPALQDPAQGVLFSNLNTAFNGVLDTDIRIDDTVVVFGQGVVGLLVTQFLKRTPARTIVAVESIPARQALAKRFGAHVVLDPTKEDIGLTVRHMTGGRGADVTIEASGSYAALQEAIRTAAPDTTVTVLSWYGGTGQALAFSDEFHHNRITLKSSQVGKVGPDLSATHSLARRAESTVQAFGELDLEPLISDRVPFADAPKGYALVDTRDPNTTQVVFSYE
jgi:threonine dehydrogenase-like Zn-dependent dehydrogenase